MIEYREERGNIFEKYMNKPVSFAHCISGDFALGAGIAEQFNNRFHIRGFIEDDVSLWYESSLLHLYRSSIQSGYKAEMLFQTKLLFSQ